MKKNVTKLLAILLAAVMLLSLCACGGESDSNEVEVGKTYDFGKYELVYKSACIMPDDEGADSLVVYFDFTNNSDSAASFGWTVFWTVTQGDEALEPNFVITNPETISYVGETSFTDIEPGTTVEVGNSFKLKNTTDEVKVNISDLLDKYSYNLTFAPAELERVDPQSEADVSETGSEIVDKTGSEVDSSEAGTEVGTEVDSDDPFLGWWSGEWYGWWGIRTASGDYEAIDGAWWDTCAVIEVGEPAADSGYNATITLWDEDGSRTGTLIGEVEVTLSPYGVGEHGTMYSESGSFMDQVLGHADWIIDPALENFENLITLEGEYSGDEGSYTYMVILRPWGTVWDDMSESSLPYVYNEWYLPLIESGASMPDTIGEAASSDNTASDTPAVTEAPTPTEAPAVEPDPTDAPAAVPTGKMIPFTVEGYTAGDKTPFTFKVSLPEGTWDLETYKASVFPYNQKIYNCPDANDAPFGTPFIWIQFYDNEEKLNFYVADYANLSETEGRTISGIEMQGRKYDYVGYKQMQEYYGVLPSGVGVSILFVKVPDELLPECYAILDTLTFE